MIRKYKIELLLFISAFAAQLVIFFLTVRFGAGGFLWSADTESYFTLAKNLLTHHGFFVRPEWGPSAFRTPLYPLFVAALYALAPKLGFVIFVQNILGAFSVVFVYRLAKNIFGSRIAVFASSLFLLESQRLQVTNQLMSESLFIIFFIPALILFFKYRKDKKLIYIFFCGTLFGLSALTRPVVQYLPAAMIFFIFFEKPVKLTWRKNILASCFLLLAFAATLSPWLVRNKIHFDVWKLSPLGGTNLYYTSVIHFFEYQAKKQGEEKDLNKEYTDKALHDLNLNVDRSNWTEESIRLMEFAHEPYFMRESLKIIFDNFPAYLIVHVKRLVPFFIDSSLSRSSAALLWNIPNRPDWLFYPYFYWGGRALRAAMFLIIFVSFSYFGKIIRKRLWFHAFFITVMLYWAALSAMNWDAPRMRLPINPLIFMLFAEATLLIVGHLHGKKGQELEEYTYGKS